MFFCNSPPTILSESLAMLACFFITWVVSILFDSSTIIYQRRSVTQTLFKSMFISSWNCMTNSCNWKSCIYLFLIHLLVLLVRRQLGTRHLMMTLLNLQNLKMNTINPWLKYENDVSHNTLIYSDKSYLRLFILINKLSFISKLQQR